MTNSRSNLKRPHTITVNVDSKELGLLHAAAKSLGLNLTNYARSTLFADAKTRVNISEVQPFVPVVKKTDEEIAQLVAEVRGT